MFIILYALFYGIYIIYAYPSYTIYILFFFFFFYASLTPCVGPHISLEMIFQCKINISREIEDALQLFEKKYSTKDAYQLFYELTKSHFPQLSMTSKGLTRKPDLACCTCANKLEI
jgi:hypothetical protein